MAAKINKTERVMKLITKDKDISEESDNESEDTQESGELQAEEAPAKQTGKVKTAPVAPKPPPPAEPDPAWEAAIRQDERDRVLREVEEARSREVEEIWREAERKAEQRNTKFMVESALFDNDDHVLNMTQVLVKEMMPAVMERMGTCNCQICTANVLAIAMNNLPSMYVTSDTGKQYAKLDTHRKQLELDILGAITKACVKVNAAPRH